MSINGRREGANLKSGIFLAMVLGVVCARGGVDEDFLDPPRATRVQNSKIDIGCHEIGAGKGLSIVIR